jgi:hypothetical protein
VPLPALFEDPANPRTEFPEAGLVACEGQGGAVTPNRRFGPAANLNIHFHDLVVDGASPYGADGVPVLVEEGAPIE